MAREVSIPSFLVADLAAHVAGLRRAPAISEANHLPARAERGDDRVGSVAYRSRKRLERIIHHAPVSSEVLRDGLSWH